MNKKDIENYKTKLLEEKLSLENEIASIGKRDSGTPGGWDATSGGLEVDPADDNEVADKLEELDENTAIVSKLDAELMAVKSALERIENGTFGLCGVCSKPIEPERLAANPSATISLKHGH